MSSQDRIIPNGALDAIAARDADRAEPAMAEHIVQLTASYWDALEGKPCPV